MADVMAHAGVPGPEEPAGMEFLRSRLRRAATVPSAEQPVEVQQLLLSTSLLDQVRRLLPVAAKGRPSSAAPSLHQLTVAFAAAAAAEAAAPQPPPLASEARICLTAYRPAMLAAAAQAEQAEASASAIEDLEGGRASSGRGGGVDANVGTDQQASSSGRAADTEAVYELQLPDSLPHLARLLAHSSAAVEAAEQASLAANVAAALEAYERLAALVRLLSSPAWQRAADQQLAALWQWQRQQEGQHEDQQPSQPRPEAQQPPPGLTACQIKFAVASALAELVSALLNNCGHHSRPAAAASTQQLARLRGMAAGAAAALLRLAPDSPKACLLAAFCVLASDGSYRGQPGAQQQALHLYQRSFELARQQPPAGSPYWTVRTAAGWVMLAAVAPAVQRSQLEAALTAFQHAEAALALCRRQRWLPAMWLQVRGRFGW